MPGEAAEESLVTRRAAGKDADGAGTAELRETTAYPRLAAGTTPEGCWAWRAVGKTKLLEVTAWAESKGPSNVIFTSWYPTGQPWC